MIDHDFFCKVNELARSAGISVAELCRRAGVSRGTISRWATGQTQPSLRIWIKLEEAAKGGEK